MARFARGGVVQLRSGGPRMTIDRIVIGPQPDRAARCFWFERERITWSIFPLHMLKIVREERAAPDAAPTRERPRREDDRG